MEFYLLAAAAVPIVGFTAFQAYKMRIETKARVARRERQAAEARRNTGYEK